MPEYIDSGNQKSNQTAKPQWALMGAQNRVSTGGIGIASKSGITSQRMQATEKHQRDDMQQKGPNEILSPI